ncbi:MAG: hypothetical protein ACK4SZ_04005 [Allosphingosinicella sp.]|uniref:hypothetical protein n=1 Tax=Allosphingosinicella sp. TaxID=2823234 RepID=UPI00393860E0
MSAAATPRMERFFEQMKQATRPAATRLPLPNGAATHFVRDPNRVAGATEWPADDTVTPAARLRPDLQLVGRPNPIPVDDGRPMVTPKLERVGYEPVGAKVS